MADLGRLCHVCDQFAVGLDRSDFACDDSVFFARRDRDTGDGGAVVAQPRRSVSRVPAHHQRVCSLVSQEGESMTTVTEREASHANWLPAAQDQPEKRFWYEPLVESGLVPDALIRASIRKMLRERLQEEDRGSTEANRAALLAFVEQMKQSPIALRTDSANAQHYEVPAAFFESVLGPRLKYSSAFYAEGGTSLAEAEEAMLQLTCERAQLADGQEILELGCGWGSLTLWMAEHFPNSRITGVSNSSSQRQFIMARAAQCGLHNVRVITADMNKLSFSPWVQFDRVVSVEMFEHMRN